MAIVHVLQGLARGAEVWIAIHKDCIWLGRDPESDILIPDPNASRMAARITRVHDRFCLEYLGSDRQPFSLNGNRVAPRKPVDLKHGDRIAYTTFVASFLVSISPGVEEQSEQ